MRACPTFRQGCHFLSAANTQLHKIESSTLRIHAFINEVNHYTHSEKDVGKLLLSLQLRLVETWISKPMLIHVYFLWRNY